jgi:phytanoyl-CoA hydroxylase
MAVATRTKVDLERFRDEGYLVVEDVLDVERDLDPVVAEYTQKLDDLARTWHAEGKLTSTYAELPFVQRLAQVLTETGRTGYQPLDISLPFTGVTEETPIHLGPATFRLLTSPRLLDAVEQVVGPEVLSNPIQHVRIKPPERLLPEEFRSSLVGQTDWHQDQGVALPEIDETEMLTVWLPITDATEENGCLCVVPRSHTRGLVTHCPGRAEGRKGLHIPDSIRGESYTPVPIRRGGALFLHRRTMHASLRNVSDGARWSYDLRYQPIGQPTGRPWFPSFVVRSRSRPESEVHDPEVWASLWRQTRSHLAATPPEGKFNRWTGEEEVCEVA